jgi:hypothetical protein
MTSQIAASPISVSAAAVAAQEHWVETQTARLTCLGQADREVTAAQLKCAAARTGLNWTTFFAAKVSSFAFWSGIVFASVIGATLWAAKIPSRHTPAAITAASYFLIIMVAAPVCRRYGRRILSHLKRISKEAPRHFLMWYLAALTAAAILYATVNATASNSAAVRVSFFYYIHELIAFTLVTALGFVIAYLVLAYAYASALQKPGSSETSSWAGTLAASAVTAWIPVAHGSFSSAGNPCLDSALLGLLDCTVTIDELGQANSLADPRAVKSVILSLELVAADVEQYAVSRVPRFDAATRRLARQDGAHLASVIRNTKAPVAGAVHPRNYTTVAAALADFLLAWARSEQSEFTTIITDDPSISRTPSWRRIAGRIWSAALLVAGGVFLPLLPIYNGDHAAAAGLRYALFTAAVLALAAPGAPASDIIQRNLEKTLPGGLFIRGCSTHVSEFRGE